MTILIQADVVGKDRKKQSQTAFTFPLGQMEEIAVLIQDVSLPTEQSS